VCIVNVLFALQYWAIAQASSRTQYLYLPEKHESC
jgi:hypothetical protein